MPTTDHATHAAIAATERLLSKTPATLTTPTPLPARAILSNAAWQELQRRLARRRHREAARRYIKRAMALLDRGSPAATRALLALARWELHDHLSLGIVRKAPPELAQAASRLAEDYDAEVGRLIPLDVLVEATVEPLRSAATHPSVAVGR